MKAPSDTLPRSATDLPTGALFVFVPAAFAIAWGAIAPWLVAPDTAARLFGPLSATHPAFILAVYAPAFTAFGLVLARGGPAALGRFLSRLLLWRASAGWYLFLLAGIPAIYVAGALLRGTPGDHALPAPTLAGMLGLMAFMLVLGPVEEFGWRGVALPLLQRRLAPVWAGGLLGLIWGLWHLPAFYLSGTPQGAWDFTPFLVGSVAVSVILTPLFNDARGSILLAMLFHFQLNNPLWPDAQPWDMALFALTALCVVWLFRRRMFRRGAWAATTVIPPARPARAGQGADRRDAIAG